MKEEQFERVGRWLGVAGLVAIVGGLVWSGFVLDQAETAAPSPYAPEGSGTVETAIATLTVGIPLAVSITLVLALASYPMGQPGGQPQAIAVVFAGAIGLLLGAGYWIGSLLAVIAGVLLYLGGTERDDDPLGRRT